MQKPQVVCGRSGYIKSVMAEDTQAPDNMAVEVVDGRSPTKTASKLGHSSGTNASTMIGAGSRAQSSRAPSKQDSSSDEYYDTHRRGVKKVKNKL